MLTVCDMFCGAGGSSIGAEMAGARLRMGLNHWQRAIDTHATNFPDADHDCTDVSATNPRRYPRTDILLASPECTNHSLAKGAKRKGLSQYDAFMATTDDPAAERSRATMWDVPRFAEHHRYQLVIVENVVDVRHWQPFPAWLHAMHTLGYEHRCVYLNSMFAHPTPQSRDRIYVVFWRRGNRAPDLDIRPPAWCARCERDVESVQSWKPARSAGRYRQQYIYACPGCASQVEPYYYAALNAIDWTIPAERIGYRKKQLRPRTLDRIRYGLEKFGQSPLVITGWYTSGVYAMATLPPVFLLTYRNYGGGLGYPVDDLTQPLRTAVTYNQYRLVINGAALLAMRDSDRPAQLVREVTDPLHTQATMPQLALIQRQPFLISYYGNLQASGAAEAMFTLSTRDRHALVQPEQAIDIEDCYFRMLKPPEIGAGMAFPSDYIVLGNASEKVKQLGNAVTPPAMRELMRRGVESLA